MRGENPVRAMQESRCIFFLTPTETNGATCCGGESQIRGDLADVRFTAAAPQPCVVASIMRDVSCLSHLKPIIPLWFRTMALLSCYNDHHSI